MAMPDHPPEFCFVQVTIVLRGKDSSEGPSYDVSAGDSRADLTRKPPAFQTDEMSGGKIACSQILKKLAQAVDGDSKPIKIRVDNIGIILPDPEPAPPLPPEPFYAVILTYNATIPVLDNDSVLLVELKLDKPIPNDSGSMVLFSPSSDGSAPAGAADPTDKFSFVSYVGAANDQPAETSFLRFKIKTVAAAGFIQKIKDKPNAHLFLAHNQPNPPAKDRDKAS
jgi:hypothetical protein